jgi:hypothetical protein
VSDVTVYGLDDRGFVSRQRQGVFSSLSRSNELYGHSPSYPMRTRCSFLESNVAQSAKLITHRLPLLISLYAFICHAYAQRHFVIVNCAVSWCGMHMGCLNAYYYPVSTSYLQCRLRKISGKPRLTFVLGPRASLIFRH